MLGTVLEELLETPENLKVSSAAQQQPGMWLLTTRACNFFSFLQLMSLSFKFTHLKNSTAVFISHLIEITLYYFRFNCNLQNNVIPIKIHRFWRLSETDTEDLVKIPKGSLPWTKKKGWLRQSININLSCINICILQVNSPRIKCSSAPIITVCCIQSFVRLLSLI